MGRKRTTARKYLYISFACVISFFFTGCVMLTEMKATMGARQHLAAAQTRFDQGDYDGSLKENQRVLSLYAKVPPGDEALFNMGLIYAHYGYAGKDFEKSHEYFKRLVKVFPSSSLAGQAKIWMGMLREIEKLEEVSRSVRKLQSENERLGREIQDLKVVMEKSKQVDIQIDEKKKELSK